MIIQQQSHGRKLATLTCVWLGAISNGCFEQPTVVLGEPKASGSGGDASTAGGSGGDGSTASGSGGDASTGGAEPQGIGGSEQPPLVGVGEGTGGSLFSGMGGAAEFPPPERPCHDGPRYFSEQRADGTYNYYPVECLTAPETSPLYQMCTTVRSFDFLSTCEDLGHGFNGDGHFVQTRQPGDIPVPRLLRPDNDNVWDEQGGLGFNYACHAGGTVIGTYECGDVPSGEGGEIVPGTYALTSMVEYGDASFHIPANNFQQTLLVTDTSMALLSDDSAIFIFRGAYTFTTAGNAISFSIVNAMYDGDPVFTPFTDVGTYTATSRTLHIYSESRGFSAFYELVTP